MYTQQSLQDHLFLMLYGGVAILAILTALYLLFRRANAIAPNVTPPKALRWWTAAFFLVVALSHVWWYVIGVYWLADDHLIRIIITIMLDRLTLVTLVMELLLYMLQDQKRRVWPWALAQLPIITAAILGIVKDDKFIGLEIMHYWQLAVIIVFIAYYVHALIQYSRWLRENFADLEHKEVWQSLVFVIILFVVYDVYTNNAGEMIKEYLAQLISIVLIGFLLWRVETLQRLEPEEELSADESDYSYIGALLEQHCEAQRLYLQHDLTLSQLAAALGTNRTYLSAYFAQAGTNYNAYINLLRIEHFERLYAKAAAISRPITAQKLAFESGFRSYSTFSNAFKKHKGITVQAWMGGEVKTAID